MDVLWLLARSVYSQIFIDLSVNIFFVSRRGHTVFHAHTNIHIKVQINPKNSIRLTFPFSSVQAFGGGVAEGPVETRQLLQERKAGDLPDDDDS